MLYTITTQFGRVYHCYSEEDYEVRIDILERLGIEFTVTKAATAQGEPPFQISRKETEISRLWNEEQVENLIRLAMQSKGHTPEYEVREFCAQHLHK